MPAAEDSSGFAVDPSGDPVVLRIQGRAGYLNSAPVDEFFRRMAAEERPRIVVDCGECTGMDSTFLGILAGAALRLRRQDPPGEIGLSRLSPRNRELVENLGLHRLVSVEGQSPPPRGGAGDRPLPGREADRSLMLEAHRRLLEADERNASRFEDVIRFLEKKRNGDGRDEAPEPGEGSPTRRGSR